MGAFFWRSLFTVPFMTVLPPLSLTRTSSLCNLCVLCVSVVSYAVIS